MHESARTQLTIIVLNEDSSSVDGPNHDTWLADGGQHQLYKEGLCLLYNQVFSDLNTELRLSARGC